MNRHSTVRKKVIPLRCVLEWEVVSDRTVLVGRPFSPAIDDLWYQAGVSRSARKK